MSTKRLFFALWPDNRQRDRLRDVINSVAKTVEGRAVDRGNWHVTLPFIGQIDERQIPDLQELAAQVQVEPFRLVFDRLEFWARPKVDPGSTRIDPGLIGSESTRGRPGINLWSIPDWP